MAKYIVPSKENIIVLCYKCKTMYVPEKRNGSYYEECPMCGCSLNDIRNTIPLWKYNLIKFFRGGFKNDKSKEGSI